MTFVWGLYSHLGTNKLTLLSLLTHVCIRECGNHWLHDDVIKWKHFPRYWPFVRGIHRSLIWSFFDLRPNKWLSKQWCGWWFVTLSSPLWRHCNWILACHLDDNVMTWKLSVLLAICDLWRYPAHYDVIVIKYWLVTLMTMSWHGNFLYYWPFVRRILSLTGVLPSERSNNTPLRCLRFC